MTSGTMFGELLGAAVGDRWVRNAFEPLSGSDIIKHNSTERSSVEFAVLVENARAKRRSELSKGWLPLLDHLPCNEIGVHDRISA